MASLEIEGKSVEEAIKSACEQLNLPREKLEIEILSAGTTGIFGLVGAKKARIRVTVREEAPQTSSVPELPDGISNGPSPAETDSETEILNQVRLLTEGILERMGLAFQVRAHWEEETLQVRIEGDKTGLLIGRQGKTLDALQYLITRILHRKTGKEFRVLLDSGGYRSRRREYLKKMALKLAIKAKQTGKPVSTGPLNAHDRRIIHLALEKDKEVKTLSRGEGLLKKVVIFEEKKETAPERPIEAEE